MTKLAGIITSAERVEKDDGRMALRVVVEFYDGNAPDLDWSVVWYQIPVTIVKVDVNGEEPGIDPHGEKVSDDRS